MIQKSSKNYKKLRKIKQVVRFLEETINLVLEDELDPKKANAIGYLSNLIVKAIESSELERRVEYLEKAVEQSAKVEN